MAVIDLNKPLPKAQPELIPIVVTSVEGAIKHKEDFSYIAAFENTNIIVKGTLAIPDDSFALPIRQNNGTLKLFLAEVVNGEFSVVLNFKDDGAFVYSDEECNLDLPSPMFTVNTMRIDILSSAS